MRWSLPDALVLCIGALLVVGCSREPESKVKRWASEIPTVAPSRAPSVDPLMEPIPQRVDASQMAPGPKHIKASPPIEPHSCARLVDRACATLGVHSDECREVRDLVPTPEPPAIRAACSSVIESQQRLLNPGDLSEGQSPCLLFVRKTCKRSGYKSELCEEAKDASRLLTAARRTDACIGELLLFELKLALNPLGSE
jgi:hypothetical protein